jgi:hypothetical protein
MKNNPQLSHLLSLAQIVSEREQEWYMREWHIREQVREQGLRSWGTDKFGGLGGLVSVSQSRSQISVLCVTAKTYHKAKRRVGV